MKQDVKKEWTRRLRSGEIEQAKDRLEREDGSKCCLGVLSHMAYEAGVVDRRLNEYGTYFQYDGHPSTLPPAVMEWAGLDHHNPTIPLESAPEKIRDVYSEEYRPSLASINDYGTSFAEIADIIDAHF
jgi:hypothetical protein